jgi:hypothetical protein
MELLLETCNYPCLLDQGNNDKSEERQLLAEAKTRQLR